VRALGFDLLSGLGGCQVPVSRSRASTSEM
jgi:hypothetical protein